MLVGKGRGSGSRGNRETRATCRSRAGSIFARPLRPRSNVRLGKEFQSPRRRARSAFRRWILAAGSAARSGVQNLIARDLWRAGLDLLPRAFAATLVSTEMICASVSAMSWARAIRSPSPIFFSIAATTAMKKGVSVRGTLGMTGIFRREDRITLRAPLGNAVAPRRSRLSLLRDRAKGRSLGALHRPSG